MTDIGCPQCGHRALSVATRCPKCGHEFSAELIHPRTPSPERRLPRPAWVAGGALAAVVAAGLVVGGWGSGPNVEGPLTATRSAALAESAADSGAAAVQPPAPRVAPPAAEPPLLRYATTWINVRAARGTRGRPVRVLSPGDPVLVDSLVGGWYRVVEQGRTVGYASRRLFASRHAADGPER
jgi:DNA-directed RNA polymerase subunit RPC12/RpoP